MFIEGQRTESASEQQEEVTKNQNKPAPPLYEPDERAEQQQALAPEPVPGTVPVSTLAASTAGYDC